MAVASNRRLLQARVELDLALEDDWRFEGVAHLDVRRVRDKGAKDARVQLQGTLEGRVYDACLEEWYDVRELHHDSYVEARWVDGELPVRERSTLREFADDRRFWAGLETALKGVDIAGALAKTESAVASKRAKEKATALDTKARVELAEQWATRFRALYEDDVQINVWTKGDVVRVYFNWRHDRTGPMWDNRPRMVYIDSKGVLRGKGSQRLQKALESLTD